MNNNEKLKEAKRLYTTATPDQKYVLESLFPELAESEDERIRKALIQYIKNWEANIQGEAYPYLWSSDEEECNKLLAWLEKQGNNLVENGYTNNKDIIKYADNYSHEIWHKLMDNFENIKDYHIGCNDVSDIVLNAIIDAYNWFEKQGEQTINRPDFEIPFGAKDSELIEESYYIPKGYHAEISKDKVTIKNGEQRTNSQNAQDIIKKYVSDHADCRWLDASELEQLLNDFILKYDKIKNREYEQQCKVSNDGNNR